MARWKFTDVRSGAVSYTFEVNPNEGGSPAISKAVATNNPLGPGLHAIFSEGRVQVGPQEFGGVLLTQTQFENMQSWALKRTLLQVEDDLGRKFQGVLSTWSPRRVRKPYNPWYHTYSATLTVTAMTNATTGTTVFGYMQPLGV